MKMQFIAKFSPSFLSLISVSPCIFLGYVYRYFSISYFSVARSCFRIMHIKKENKFLL